MGCTAAIVFTCLGASYGTAKSGVGIAAMGVLRPDLIVKSAFTTAQWREGYRGTIANTLLQTSSPSLWRVSSVSTV
jgi:V-type H+-transporting ATPase proteolipid subunit